MSLHITKKNEKKRTNVKNKTHRSQRKIYYMLDSGLITSKVD